MDEAAEHKTKASSEGVDGSASSMLPLLLSPKSEDSNNKSPSSPEPGCVICLGKLENKSFTDSCFHQFCFTCLLEWSKVKAECPLCKQPFKSIIHNVRSNEDYDQYHLRPQDVSSSWPTSEGRRFRYRSTLTAERRRELALERLFMGQFHHRANEILRCRWGRQNLHHGTVTEFRQQVYAQNMWAMPLEQMQSPPQRYHDVSALFFYANPACTHRLIPWLNRELVVLLSNHETQISFVLDLIVSLIQRYDIRSPEFREHVNPYFGARTDHFIHEFHNYARSPWDMVGYDRHVSYPSATQETDNDVIILSPNEPITIPGENETLPTDIDTPPPASNVQLLSRTTATSSSSSSSSSQPGLIPSVALHNVKRFLSSVSMPGEGWHSPTDLTSNPWDSPVTSRQRSSGVPSNALASPQPGPSGLSRTLTVRDSSDSDDDPPSFAAATTHASVPTKVEITDDDSDDVDCHVVGFVKPIKERTPELIDLVSDSSSNGPSPPTRRKHHQSSSGGGSSSSSSGSRTGKQPPAASTSSKSHFSRHEGKSQQPRCPKEVSSRRESSQHWRWTSYEGGGGKFQRTYSPMVESGSSGSSSRRTVARSKSRDRAAPRSRERTPSEKKRHSSRHHKKHKKHKHKHSHKESRRRHSADKHHRSK